MGRIFYYKSISGGVGVYESNDVFISISLTKNGKGNIFALKPKNHRKMREHRKELIQIAGYVFAIAGHLVLITWLSLLLNHSLNII